MCLRDVSGDSLLVDPAARLPGGLERPHRALRSASDRGARDPPANVAQRRMARARPLRTADALAGRDRRARCAGRCALRAQARELARRARAAAAAIPGHLRPARRGADLHGRGAGGGHHRRIGTGVGRVPRAPALVNFRALASLLLPALPERTGIVLDADEHWSFDGRGLGADVVVWGRAPTGAGMPLATVTRAALARARAR